MTWKYTDEYYREYTRTTWNESAHAYTPLLRNLGPFRADLLQRLRLRPGERVLDIATGPGEPALTIADQVGPKGEVVGIDLAERMVELARRGAEERKLRNARFEVMDAEQLAFEDASFDVVLSAFGLQIVTDPERVAREARRVLKPNGRVGFTVWGPGEKVPAIHAIIGPMLEHAEPDETGYLPTPYEMGGPGELVKFLEQAGFRGAREERVTHDWAFESVEAWLRAALDGTPIGHSLGEEDEAVQREVLAKTRVNMQRYLGPSGVRVPAECVIVTAHA